MCPTGQGLVRRPKGIMPWQIFTRVIDDCASFEGNGLTIHLHLHGEPLFDPLIFKKIEYIKTKLSKSTINFNTNAALLDEDRATRLIKSGIHQVTFSLNGTSVTSYEKISKGMEYPVVLENLTRYLSICNESKIKPHNIIQLVVCEANQNEIDDFKKLWGNLADELHIKAMHNFLDMGTSVQTIDLAESQVCKCKQPFEFLMIYWNGDIGLCCWDYNNFARLGNVKESHLLKKYNNKHYERIRTAMDKMDCSEIMPCNRCSQIYGNDMNQILEIYNCSKQNTT